jgi:hypothetical protein
MRWPSDIKDSYSWGVGRGISIPHRKIYPASNGMFHKASGFNGLFTQTQTENSPENWNSECLEVKFVENNDKNISKVKKKCKAIPITGREGP